MSKRKILMSFAVLCMLSTAAVAEGPKAGGVVNAVIADQVDFGFTGGTWGPSVSSGTIKLLASAPRDPLKSQSQVPTLRQLAMTSRPRCS